MPSWSVRAGQEGNRVSVRRVRNAVELLQLLGDVAVERGVVALRELPQPVDLVEQGRPLGADAVERLGVGAPGVALDRARLELGLAGDLLRLGPGVADQRLRLALRVAHV